MCVAGWIILPQVNPHANTQYLSHCLMRPEGLGRCVQLKPLRWGVSWSSRWGQCDHRVLMKGKQGGVRVGGGHDSGSRALCDALWKWKVAPSQGMRAATRSCKRARKGTPLHQPAEGASSASTFRLGLPDFSLLISRTVEEWICV